LSSPLTLVRTTAVARDCSVPMALTITRTVAPLDPPHRDRLRLGASTPEARTGGLALGRHRAALLPPPGAAGRQQGDDRHGRDRPKSHAPRTWVSMRGHGPFARLGVQHASFSRTELKDHSDPGFNGR